MAGKAGPWRAWTDDEYGLIQAHPDWTNRQLAEALGRTANSVGLKRRALAQGWMPEREHWSDEEIFTIRSTPHLTAVQVAALLGRSVRAVGHKRSSENAEAYTNKSPFVVGGRPLIARTCRYCGKLLAAKWFTAEAKPNGGEVWTTACRKCASVANHAGRPRPPKTDADRDSRRRSTDALQRISQTTATRKGQVWLDTDHGVLSNPDLSLLEKAVTLGRTYFATASACSKGGYASKVGLGSVDDQWLIDNPYTATA